MRIPEELIRVWDIRWDQHHAKQKPGHQNELHFWTWWLVAGQGEHPNIATSLSQEALDCITDATHTLNEIDPASGLTLLQKSFWNLFPSIHSQFDLTHATGRAQYASWLVREASNQNTPSPIHRRDFYKVGFSAAPSPTPGVTVVGYAKSEMGIGEVCRSVALGLAYETQALEVFSLSTGNNNPDQDLSLQSLLSEKLKYQTQILCVSPIDTQVLYARVGPKFFENRYRIGFWTWELDQWPKAWDQLIDYVDEIWSLSQHSAQGLLNHPEIKRRSIPVRVMPLRVEAPIGIKASRAQFGIPSEPFVFHFAFDPHSFVARKNPHAVLKCFRRLNRELPNTHLVLKLNSWKPELLDAALLELISQTPHLTVISDTLSRRDNLSLLASCDAHVSLHRAEGFGLMMAEAMLLRKPVIATAYSGNLEFCNDQTADLVPVSLVKIRAGEYLYSEGLEWGEPDTEVAYQHMKNLALRGPDPLKLAAAESFILEHYSERAVGKKIAARLKSASRG